MPFGLAISTAILAPVFGQHNIPEIRIDLASIREELL
jgi:hypothetical protein